MNIRELREKKNMSQQDLANATGIPRERIGKWEQGKGSPKIDDYKILEAFFGELVTEKPVKSEQPAENQNQTIQTLVESNKVLAEANKRLADAHYIIAESHQTIVRRNESLFEQAKHPTVNGAEEIQKVFDAKISHLLEFLIQVGTGTRWKTPQEAMAAINTSLYQSLPVKQVSGIHTGKDKKNIGS